MQEEEKMLRMRSIDKAKLLSSKPIITPTESVKIVPAIVTVLSSKPIVSSIPETIDLVRHVVHSIQDATVDTVVSQVTGLCERLSTLQARLSRKKNLDTSKLSLSDRVILEDAITRNQMHIDEVQSKIATTFESIRLCIAQKKNLLDVLKEDEDVNVNIDTITKDISRMEHCIQ